MYIKIIDFNSVIPVVLHAVIKIGTVKSNTTVDILLLRIFIDIAYLRNNNVFRPFCRPSSC